MIKYRGKSTMTIIAAVVRDNVTWIGADGRIINANDEVIDPYYNKLLKLPNCILGFCGSLSNWNVLSGAIKCDPEILINQNFLPGYEEQVVTESIIKLNELKMFSGKNHQEFLLVANDKIFECSVSKSKWYVCQHDLIAAIGYGGSACRPMLDYLYKETDKKGNEILKTAIKYTITHSMGCGGKIQVAKAPWIKQ